MGRRTQITLTDDQHARLVDEAYRTGLSMAELVRRSVDAAYRPDLRAQALGYEVSFGIWRRPDAAVVARRMLPRRVVDDL